MFKLVVASALLAVAFATTGNLPDGRIMNTTYTDDHYYGPYAYGPAPYKEEKLASQPFAYEYGVADDYPKANFKRTDSQDANGNIKRSIAIPLPEEKLIPQPFAYEYGVQDDYSKTNFKKIESQDANGNVQGSIVIVLPDGRIQTTTYTADHYNGFIAEVTYEGTPVYPPEPAGGYGHARPHARPRARPQVNPRTNQLQNV